VFVDIPVILYSSPSSKSSVEAVVEKFKMSPTLKSAPSSTSIVVSPTAVLEASFTSDIVAPLVVCSKAAAEGQVETSKLFPCAPAVLAANVPITPAPLSKFDS